MEFHRKNRGNILVEEINNVSFCFSFMLKIINAIFRASMLLVYKHLNF